MALLFGGEVAQHAAGRFVDVFVLLRAGRFRVLAEGEEEDEGACLQDGGSGWAGRYAARFGLAECYLCGACLREQEEIGCVVDRR